MALKIALAVEILSLKQIPQAPAAFNGGCAKFGGRGDSCHETDLLLPDQICLFVINFESPRWYLSMNSPLGDLCRLLLIVYHIHCYSHPILWCTITIILILYSKDIKLHRSVMMVTSIVPCCCSDLIHYLMDLNTISWTVSCPALFSAAEHWSDGKFDGKKDVLQEWHGWSLW